MFLGKKNKNPKQGKLVTEPAGDGGEAQSGLLAGLGGRDPPPQQSPPTHRRVSFIARKGRAYKYPNSKFSRSIRNSPGLFLSAVTKGL